MMWKSVFVLSLILAGSLALPVDLLKELLKRLEEKDMSVRNIYTADSDTDSIAVGLQRDSTWPSGFTVDMNRKLTGSADSTKVDVFKGKSWSELESSYKVTWGKLAGYKYSVSIDGLTPGTSYDIQTVVKSGNTVIGGQTRAVVTKATKSLDDELADLLERLSKKEMSTRNIFQADSDSDSVAVALQQDKNWPGGFKISLKYKITGADDNTKVAVFEDKSWSELESYKVTWGKLAGYKYSESIDGLTPGTSYDIQTVVKSGNEVIGGQIRTVTTKAQKSLDVKLAELLREFEKKDMNTRNIYSADSDSDSIAVALQRDRDWPGGFKMSLSYKKTGAGDNAKVDVFKDKTWSELESYKVTWGKLTGYKYSVSMDGLAPGTSYDIKTVVKSGETVIGGQMRMISTKGGPSVNSQNTN